MVGVLGPNGAGKTTTVRILVDAAAAGRGAGEASGGTMWCGIRWAGTAVDRADRAVRLGRRGAVGDREPGAGSGGCSTCRSGTPPRGPRSCWRRFFAHRGAAGKPLSTFSGGMRRRLDLAASLVRRPQVIYLDEPTTGLDPHARNEVWDVVRKLVDDGSTVLLTTQYLEEADQLGRPITVFDRGRVVAEGRPGELKRRGRRGRSCRCGRPWRGDVGAGGPDPDRADRRASPAPQRRQQRAPPCPPPTPCWCPRWPGGWTRAGISADELGLRLPSLDEVFLALTGRPATGDESTDSTGDTKSDTDTERTAA